MHVLSLETYYVPLIIFIVFLSYHVLFRASKLYLAMQNYIQLYTKTKQTGNSREIEHVHTAEHVQFTLKDCTRLHCKVK